MSGIGRGELPAALALRLLMRELVLGGLEMLFPHGGLFLRSGHSPRASGAVEAGTIDDGRVVNHGAIHVDVSDYRIVHVEHRSVIAEEATGPDAAAESHACIA